VKISRLLQKIIKQFKKMNCFIVWAKDKNWLQHICLYYNWCNHYNIFKPILATQVFGKQFIWTKLGHPTLPKYAINVCWLTRQTKKNANIDKKYKMTKDFNVYIKFSSWHQTFHLNQAKWEICIFYSDC
jgi:hypothetical protein